MPSTIPARTGWMDRLARAREQIRRVAARWLAAATALWLVSLGVGNARADTVGDLVDRVVRAHGGIERLEGIESIEFEMTGYRIMRHQSRRTHRPWDRVPVRLFLAIDFERGWAVRDGVGAYPGGLAFPSRTVIGPDGDIGMDTEQRTYNTDGAMMGLESMHAAARLLVPPLLVRELARRRDEVTALPPRTFEGTVYAHLRLDDIGVLVDPVTHRVFATENARDDMATAGEVEELQIYAETLEYEGMSFAASYLEFLPGEGAFTLDHRLTHLALNVDIRPHLGVPGGFVPARNPHMGYANPGGLQARRIADGVYLAGDHGTNVLYVEFADHWVAMETGGMAWYAEAVHDAMRPHMGDKPLRYVVPTHYHDDHAVGLRYYVAQGVRVVTTPDKAGYLRMLLAPVDDGRLADAIEFEWIDGAIKRFGDAPHGFEVRVYADAPHSENMLVGLLPGIGAVFTADLFIGWGGTDDVRQGASFGLRHFDGWLGETLGPGAAAIDRFLPAHGRPYTRAEIDTLLARPKTFVALPGNRVLEADRWFIDYGLFDETLAGRRQRPVTHRSP